MAKKEEWYAVRARPGSMRQASSSDRYDSTRQDESILERNIRNGGFQVFVPSGKIEIKHHRTKKWIDKRFPLLPGYAFVEIGNGLFADVEAIEGVGRILRVAWVPYCFNADTIATLRILDWEANQSFAQAKAHRIRKEELDAKITTRKDVAGMYPRGHKFTLSKSASFGAGFSARVLGPASRGRVKAIIESMDSIATTMDIPIEWMAEEVDTMLLQSA